MNAGQLQATVAIELVRPRGQWIDGPWTQDRERRQAMGRGWTTGVIPCAQSPGRSVGKLW